MTKIQKFLTVALCAGALVVTASSLSLADEAKHEGHHHRHHHHKMVKHHEHKMHKNHAMNNRNERNDMNAPAPHGDDYSHLNH